jgi:XTP/dITP diphosphohydrolase
VTAPDGARLVLATHNPHKVVELREILADVVGERGLDVDLERAVVGVEAFEGVEEVVENGATFAANALLKAHAVCAATGLPALADDSGLAVDILGGSPGIFSARWSGRHGDDAANLALLLAQLSDVESPHRAAHFACAAALAMPDGTVRVAEGRLTGTLRTVPAGTGGFGYDPVLQPDGPEDMVRGRTCAELTPEEKNSISHRGKAFRALAPQIGELLGAGGAGR